MAEYGYYDVLVIGSGAAGYATAISIEEKSVAIVSEDINYGTSRNTGSDKQTYYKLGLGGSAPDSVRKMASDLFYAGAVDGDNALCEAALSARCFYRLCGLGVGFPSNRYGEYVGYKTDHDPYARATSAGPLTSKYMTEALEKEAQRLDVPVLDGLLAVEILKNGNEVCGLLCIDKKSGAFRVIRCTYVVLATGGPAGIYADSVYPKCHTGATSLALFAGVALQNMTEWQYGLASVEPRWNVSGSYMQVLPRFVSVGDDGYEDEFLLGYFGDAYAAMSAVFMKGYQWPFDSAKVLDGSSVIDVLVYVESVLKGRRVYLDFSKNPFGLENIEFERLSAEARDYLDRAGICFGTPIERLEKMNSPAVELYENKGVDLRREYLEIALCAQHNNGGIAVDLWWQTSLTGLFAAGECAGTHGVKRPGGSALNAGQVGALRAAMYISHDKRSATPCEVFSLIVQNAIEKHEHLAKRLLKNDNNVDERLTAVRKANSACCAAIRELDGVGRVLRDSVSTLESFADVVGVSDAGELYKAYKLMDAVAVSGALAKAICDFVKNVGVSRGSALYTDPHGKLRDGLAETFRFTTGDECPGMIQEVRLTYTGYEASWRSVRPIPEDNDFFENVWRTYRENGNVY